MSVKRVSLDKVVDRNDKRHDSNKVKIKTKARGQQNVEEEQVTTLEPGVTVQEELLNYKGKLLQFSHIFLLLHVGGASVPRPPHYVLSIAF